MVTLTGALWRLFPAQTPTLERRCSRCAGPVAFEPTGKFRLNANKRRLDAWLILRCPRCGERWKAPLWRRRPVASLDPDILVRVEKNDPELAASLAATLGGASRRFALERRPDRVPIAGAVIIEVEPAVSARLDRVLAAGLECSRAQVARRLAAGSLSVGGGRAALRRPVRDGERIDLIAAQQPPN